MLRKDSPKRTAGDAFDLRKESAAVRERYGMNAWGQQLLMARRLVEAGVEIIATEFDGPLCGRVQNWDDHAVNQHVFDAYKFRTPVFDQAVSALIEDIYARGLDQRVLVVVAGELSRMSPAAVAAWRADQQGLFSLVVTTGLAQIRCCLQEAESAPDK